MARTTNRDFNLFVREASYWIERFNLKNWEVVFFHQEVEDENLKAYRAYIDGDTINHIVVMVLNTNWYDFSPTDFDIAKVAFHEVCEILFLKINKSLKCFYSDNITDEMRHDLIVTLENCVFYHYWMKERKVRKKI